MKTTPLKPKNQRKSAAKQKTANLAPFVPFSLSLLIHLPMLPADSWGGVLWYVFPSNESSTPPLRFSGLRGHACTLGTAGTASGGGGGAAVAAAAAAAAKRGVLATAAAAASLIYKSGTSSIAHSLAEMITP